MIKAKHLAATSMAVASVFAAGSALSAEGPVPTGIPRLDHVFVIMMENHGFGQVINNPNEPYLNGLINDKKVNLATNYFAVGHPSLTNYLEIVGGSNFGIRSDNSPNWHSTTCTPNLASGIVNADDAVPALGPSQVDTGNICPIAGVGQDAATPAIDDWNEVTLPEFPYLADFDGVLSLAAESDIVGKTIADQLVRAGRTWKTYQENLPLTGADGVDWSNGTASNLSNFADYSPLTSGSVVQDYASKHDPFVYFASVQEGTTPGLSLHNVVGFDGAHGLYADLARGDVPSYSYIVPNQCDDQHGRGNADAFCAYDFGVGTTGLTYGTQVGLNPGLIEQGDTTIERIVTGIKSSPAWKAGYNAIVVVWDENDYSGVSTLPASGTPFPAQNQNTVVLTVETNYLGTHGIQSNQYYTHFSLLRSIEAGFGLPCLNHACDSGVAVMSDLFGKR